MDQLLGAAAPWLRRAREQQEGEEEGEDWTRQQEEEEERGVAGLQAPPLPLSGSHQLSHLKKQFNIEGRLLLPATGIYQYILQLHSTIRTFRWCHKIFLLV